MTQTFALTPVELEARLVRYYLHTDGAGGAGPMTYIDATRSTLRDALTAPDGETARGALLSGCGSLVTESVLAEGWSARWPRDDCPGWFRFLVLTCAVVAEAGENGTSNDFGANLNALFRTEGKFNRRQALPGLWQRLVDWTRNQRARGRQIRRVVLPPPRVGIHIGLTNAVSFPNWRDSKRIRAWLENSDDNRKAAQSPSGLARTMCLEFSRRPDDPKNDQLKQAAAEFLELYYSQSSLLRLHRLWSAVERALGRTTPKRAVVNRVRAELRPGLAVTDTTVVFQYTQDERYGSDVDENIQCRIEEAATRLANWTCSARSAIQDLRARFERGIVAFIEERFGTWVALKSTFPTGSRALFVCKAAQPTRLKAVTTAAVLKISDCWWLVGPVDGQTATHVARALGLPAGEHADRDEEPLKVDHGIRTKYGWLGRPAVLPWIHKQGPGAVELVPARPGVLAPQVGVFRDGWAPIVSSGLLDGEYRLRLEETTHTGTALSIESTLRFVADAPEHVEIVDPSAAWSLLPDCRNDAWEEYQSISPGLYPAEQSADRRTDGPTDDLLEAIYARGRIGWGEADLVPLIRDVVPGTSPWDVLQALRETGWLERTISTRVKATCWWLVKPHLVAAGSRSPVLLQGSAPARVRRRFRETVQQLGGEVREISGPSPAAPITCVAIGVDAGRLGQALEMTMHVPRIGRSAPAPACWPSDERDPSQHRRHQNWSFDAGAFVAGSPTGGTTTLTRWVRDDRAREDLFVVESRVGTRFVTPNRLIAIVEAHRRAGRAMFERRGDLLVRITREGHLPIHLARLAFLQTTVAGGPAEIDGRRTYVYPVTHHVVDVVRRVLGHSIVDGAETPVTAPDPIMQYATAAGEARHRYPTRRLAWSIRP